MKCFSFQEAAKYMNQTDISNFLDGAIRSRISIRFIAEQHIALTRALRDLMQDGDAAPSSSGIVDSECSAANMINACGNFVRDLCEATFGVAPTIQLEGMTDAKFKCAGSPKIALKWIPDHLPAVSGQIYTGTYRICPHRDLEECIPCDCGEPPAAVRKFGNKSHATGACNDCASVSPSVTLAGFVPLVSNGRPRPCSASIPNHRYSSTVPHNSNSRSGWRSAPQRPSAHLFVCIYHCARIEDGFR